MNTHPNLALTASQPVVNIAAYRFTSLTELRSLRADLLARCREWQLRGTILLSPEGINLFIAGGSDEVEFLLSHLRLIEGLEGLTAKYSHTRHQPFKRMLVRLKREIIAFGVPGIEPAKRTSAKISPQQLKSWLDEGRSITLLDTRNDYEVKLGTFMNALPIGVNQFRDFPQAVDKLPESLKDDTIVMFCTGGIRCEKAGPFMESRGFKSVLQLDGGILKYFEVCGGEHYQGECFVFDQRVGVDPALHESEAAQCFNCLSPLTKEEQLDPRYVEGRSCPWCYQSPETQALQQLQKRNQQVQTAMNPLPGSQTADVYRPLRVPQKCHGLSVLATFSQVVGHLPLSYWQGEAAAGHLQSAQHQVLDGNELVKAGDRLLHRLVLTTEPVVNGDVNILYEDDALIVLNKPAPLPMHAGGRYTRNTLQHLLDSIYAPQKPKPAHRLDANTTGLVVVARNRVFAARLQSQFADRLVSKSYLLRVHGHPAVDRYECDVPISREAGAAGSRMVNVSNGDPALTSFEVLRRDADGTSLVKAIPQTGRTHQIRIHSAHLGFPIVGDMAYGAPHTSKLGATPAPQTLEITDAPLCLHAWTLTFTHPAHHQPMSFTAPEPEWTR